MKKIVLAALAVVFMAGTALAAGDINVRLGFAYDGSSTDADGYKISDSAIDLSLSGEYLYPVADIVKVGGGMQLKTVFLSMEDVDGSDSASEILLPVYATAQINPFKNSASGIYFKGNLGFSPVYSAADGKEDAKGGLYFGLGAGYTLDCGLFFECMFESFSASYTAKTLMFGVDEYGDPDFIEVEQDIDAKNNKIGFSIGYRFSL
jgi:hypothetical protein